MESKHEITPAQAFGIIAQRMQCCIQMTSSLPQRNASLQQQAANLIDHCSTTHHPALADSMLGLEIQLIIGFDRHE